jgi:hypothetical protein
MLRQDSIHTQPVVSEITGDTTVQKPTIPQTPYQVLRLLPKDATPAQQDSAIQAWFQPGEIHYSDRPDTLHLPGHDAGRNLLEVNVPQYYRENYFANDSLYHPELNGGRAGVAGDPIPYALRNDNVITSLLLACFIFSLVAYSVSKQLIVNELKDFFYFKKQRDIIQETSTEIKALLWMMLQTCLLLALLYFFYVREYVSTSFILSDEKLLIAILFGVMGGYFFVKSLIYYGVNSIFFENKNNLQWIRSIIFIGAIEGILLFPEVVLLSYFDVSAQFIVYYTIIVLILVKILTFYKCYIIFFRQNDFYLQIILYFCTLEIVPMFALWGGLSVIVNALIINF